MKTEYIVMWVGTICSLDFLLSAIGSTDVYVYVTTKHRTSNCVCFEAEPVNGND